MIELELSPDSTLILDGPASVRIISGCLTVFGAELESGSLTVVRKDKRLPFYSPGKSRVELKLGLGAEYKIQTGDVIPSSWHDCADDLVEKCPKYVIIIGGVDSGKTSLGLYLVNRCLERGLGPVGFIDTDLGQSEIGPPGTVGLVILRDQTVDLQTLIPDWMMFLGEKSPLTVQTKMLLMLRNLVEKAEKMGARIIIVNTDGWIEGDTAVNFKKLMIGMLPSPLVIAVKRDNKLDRLLENIRVDTAVVSSPPEVRPRTHESRRELRELSYARYLKGGKVRVFREGNVRFEGEWKGRVNRLAGLIGKGGKMLGIGVVIDIDPKKKLMKIFTPVKDRVTKIIIGSIRLETTGRELTDG